MLAIAGIVLTFILTFIVGSKITQARQQDGWFAQQKFSGQEKELFELKTLSDELANAIGARVYLMKRLVLQLKAHDTDLDGAISDYALTVKKWNENLGSYYVRLSQLGLGEYRHRLEAELHIPMQIQGNKLEAIIRSKRQINKQPTGLAPISNAMCRIHSAQLHFCESLLHSITLRRNDIYNPPRIYFSAGTITTFSTWQLVKAVFVTDINRVTIIRSPLNSR